MILIPAWIVAFLTALVSVDNLLHYRHERNLLLLAKVGSWGLASVIYLMIALGAFGVDDARAFSRWAWVIVPLTELTYRYAKVRWRI